MSRNRGVYILAAKRTPFGKFWGGLKDVPAPRLGAEAIRSILAETDIDPARLSGVYMGEVLTAGVGQNPARQAARYTGIPSGVPAETFNKVCASSLVALKHAAHATWLGEAKLMIAGGMESMSQAPFLLRRWEKRTGDFKFAKLVEEYARAEEEVDIDRARDLMKETNEMSSRFTDALFLDSMMYDGLRDKYGPDMPHMGLLADLCARTYRISREEQEAYAAASHIRALEATARGLLRSQITPWNHAGMAVDWDEGMREPNAKKMKQLTPAFSSDGTVTAATSSQISDGAGALLLADADTAAKLRVRPLARIVEFATHSQDPDWYTTAPVGAIRNVLAKAGLRVGDIDRFEINEAFAVVPLHAMRELGIPHEKVNAWGGAIALGHPIGASGARIVMNVMYQLMESGGRYGIAVACNGGGEAVAVLIENVQTR